MSARKRIAGQSKTLIIAHRIFDNWRRRRERASGNTITALLDARVLESREECCYINRVYRRVSRICRLTPEALRGKRILEVGPGDNFGVALKLSPRRTKVVCLDKFYSERNVEQQTRIYHELRNNSR